MSIFGKAFSNGVWIALASVFMAGTLALSFVLRREHRLPHAASYAAKARLHKVRNAGIKADQQRFIELQERWDLSEILLVVVGAICQQGCARDPSTAASRILYLSLLLLATVVLTAFAAVLTAGVSILTSTCSNMDKMNEQLLDGNNSIELIFYPNDDRIAGTETPSKPELHLFTAFQSRESNQTLLRLLKEMEVGLSKRKTQQDMTKSCRQSAQDTPTELQFSSISLNEVWPAVAQFGVGFVIAFILFVGEVVAGRIPAFAKNNRTPEDINKR